LLPNIISLARIALIIPIALLYPDPSPTAYWVLLTLIALSYLSDYLDGLAARMLHQESKLGLILDPLADKIWTLAMIYLLVLFRDFPIWIALVIVGRDVYILILNFWMFYRKQRVLPSDEFGRKYMVILGLMIIGLTMHVSPCIWLAYGLVILAPVNLYRYTYRISKLIHKSTPSKVKTGQMTIKD